ncbi:DUF2790 domain-containing protein [Pseudomonas sp. JQ170]|uniref:DUF2790 domain-containing protein n=1 Tax=unclassified Pseudomonas TaxID=196821 RepID=UPI002652E351|nr:MULTISPECIES: DUF2790 domain-containing protein [unclassified Pseudomonas]MDN7139826.1 DUF2790 domain-containing protein [Pseudomonas sp. JQ170]WRO73720.1 DUF2790 domain-containing protein [Pseudomonas sp. 170C]
MKSLNAIGALLILTTSSFAMAQGSADPVHGPMIQANEQAMRARAVTQGKQPPEVVHYRYGMELDIAKVINVTSTRTYCDVMPAQLTYEDSSGNLNILEYRTAGTNCQSQN